jgi:hypothetical protein
MDTLRTMSSAFLTTFLRFPREQRVNPLARLPCALALLTVASAVLAQTTDTWTDGTGSWNVAGNWSAGVVPNNGGGTFYNVVISGPGGDVVTFNAAPTVVNSFELGGTRQTLQDSGGSSLTIGDPAFPNQNSFMLINNGTINWGGSGSGSSLTVGVASTTNGFVLNHGTIDIGAGGKASSLNVHGSYSGNVGGTLIVADQSVVNISSELLNQDATVSVGSAGAELNANSVVQQLGTITVASGGFLITKGMNTSGGALQGSGTIVGPLTLSGGTLQPGSSTSPGALSLNGSFIQTGGTFSEQIAGANAFGALNASGAIQLSGPSNLSINLLNGFTPNIGQTFQIATSGSGPISGIWANAPQGTFTANNLNWSANYLSGNAATLTFDGVALPTSPIVVTTFVNQTLTVVPPPSGTVTNPGTINLQQGSSLTIQGSVINLTGAAINIGNGPNGPGGNVLAVSTSNDVTNNGTINVTSGSNSVTTGNLVTSGSLTVGTGASLTTGNLNNSGPLTISSCLAATCPTNFIPVTVNGTLTNTGTVDVRPQTEDEVLRGGLTMETAQQVYNSGNIALGIIDALILVGPGEVPEAAIRPTNGRMYAAGLVDPSPPIDFNNLQGGTLGLTAAGATVKVKAGGFNNAAGASVTMSGVDEKVITANAFVNGGTVTLSARGDAIVADSFRNTGKLSIGAGGTISTTAGYSQTAGITQGAGTIQAAAGGVAITGGSILPGAQGSPSKLTVEGDYSQGSAGTMVIDINGPGNAQFGQLDVLGAAALDGKVMFDFGFTPLSGESFTFLNADAGELSGVFSSDAFSGISCTGCTLVYNDAAGTVTLDVKGPVSTPEPSPMPLLCTGMLGLVGVMLRKRLQAGIRLLR